MSQSVEEGIDVCSITYESMTQEGYDPVQPDCTKCRQTCSRRALADWFAASNDHNSCPLCNSQLRSRTMFPDVGLRYAIQLMIQLKATPGMEPPTMAPIAHHAVPAAPPPVYHYGPPTTAPVAHHGVPAAPPPVYHYGPPTTAPIAHHVAPVAPLSGVRYTSPPPPPSVNPYFMHAPPPSVIPYMYATSAAPPLGVRYAAPAAPPPAAPPSVHPYYMSVNHNMYADPMETPSVYR